MLLWNLWLGGDAADFGDNGNWTGQFDLDAGQNRETSEQPCSFCNANSTIQLAQVTSFDVIHDLTKPEATLRECKRVLKVRELADMSLAEEGRTEIPQRNYFMFVYLGLYCHSRPTAISLWLISELRQAGRMSWA